MTKAQISTANALLADIPPDQIVDLHEMGSEGCVLRTVVPGPIRGPGSWLIGRNGDAQNYDTGEFFKSKKEKNMGIDGVENLTPDGVPETQDQVDEKLRASQERQGRLDEEMTPPQPDHEVVEEQKREEEGIEPSEPVEIDPAEESSTPNPEAA